MKREVIFPQLSSKIESATLVEWRKAIGDHIGQGEVLYEVETAKTISEIEAAFSGTVLELQTEIGDELKVGDVVAILEVD